MPDSIRNMQEQYDAKISRARQTLVILEQSFSNNLIDIVSTKYVIIPVNCKLEKYKTPLRVHRKQFFQEKIERRIYQTNTFKDKGYKEQKTTDQFAETLAAILDKRFVANLDKALCD